MTDKATIELGDTKLEVPAIVGTENERAIDVAQLRAKTGYVTLAPAFMNTASCKSAITFIDGDKGILRYRGIPIEQLAEKSTFVETAYLLIYGNLPNDAQLKEWSKKLTRHSLLHEDMKHFFEGFPATAHPMAILSSMVTALSSYYPDALDVDNVDLRDITIARLVSKVRTIAAFAYKKSIGQPCVYPKNSLTYCGNFLNMMFSVPAEDYEVDPELVKVMNLLLILHADHEQNCSSTAMRGVGSSHVDPYSATAAATAALYGPLHGGANEAVLRMLVEIGSVNNVPAYVKSVKAGEKLLMGFGHRVYKNYDPRAKIVKRIAYEVFDVMGRNPLIDIALECERIALEDEYFISRRLYPNVDFYTGLIYQSMGFPVTMYPVLFAIPRTSGWIAQWQEMLLDHEQKISRPRQVYLGYDLRSYIPLDHRS